MSTSALESSGRALRRSTPAHSILHENVLSKIKNGIQYPNEAKLMSDISNKIQVTNHAPKVVKFLLTCLPLKISARSLLLVPPLE
jgi:hypothetical protein